MSSHAQLLTSLENRHGVLLQQDFLNRHFSDKKLVESANQEEEIYNAFLDTDIVQSSIPVIPPDFGQLHDVLFPASSKGIVLQINNIIDIENSAQSLLNTITVSNPVRQVYQQAPTESNAPVNFPRGTLKVEVTDGYRQITALEVKRIASLSMNTPIGAKILVKNCHIAHGTLMIEPASCQLLGGQVSCLYHGNMRKELERRLRLRLGHKIDEQDAVDDNQSPPLPLELNSGSRDRFIEIEDDVDAILQDALLDDVMDISDFASQDAHEPEIAHVSEPDYNFQQDDNDYDYEYDLSAEIDYEDEYVPLEVDTPKMSQELNDMVLRDDDDDDVFEVKVEKIKEEGSIITSVAQMKRILKSQTAQETEWQHIKKVTVEVNRIKAGKLLNYNGGRIHMLGYLELETGSNEKADRVPILFPIESLEQVYGEGIAELTEIYTAKSENNSQHLRSLVRKLLRAARVQLDMTDKAELEIENGVMAKVPYVTKYTPC
ncbi:hypothetical protein INT43_006228 [Umbelopsis isabellina]|uniref:RecQ-mediated genome instability protein 1 n=1 Tax=Mortierella isabellina TaxID=91625 RepID=A0A8H7PYV1_MORIS|nr:hypothetical protein INT43_006228 [Umbelopsis isabellina]